MGLKLSGKKQITCIKRGDTWYCKDPDGKAEVQYKIGSEGIDKKVYKGDKSVAEEIDKSVDKERLIKV